MGVAQAQDPGPWSPNGDHDHTNDGQHRQTSIASASCLRTTSTPRRPLPDPDTEGMRLCRTVACGRAGFRAGTGYPIYDRRSSRHGVQGYIDSAPECARRTVTAE